MPQWDYGTLSQSVGVRVRLEPDRRRLPCFGAASYCNRGQDGAAALECTAILVQPILGTVLGPVLGPILGNGADR